MKELDKESVESGKQMAKVWEKTPIYQTPEQGLIK